jgi:hypothetical protein
MITKPPSRKKIEELINKGGAAPKKTKKKSIDNGIITTPLRLSQGLLEAVDEKIQCPYGGKTRSRNSFIIDAIIKAIDE